MPFHFSAVQAEKWMFHVTQVGQRNTQRNTYQEQAARVQTSEPYAIKRWWGEALRMHSTGRDRGARLAGGRGGVLRDYALGRVVQHSPSEDSVTHAASHVITPVCVCHGTCVCACVCARARVHARACLRARSCLFVHGRLAGERCTTAHVPCM